MSNRSIWRQDSQGHYIVFNRGMRNIEITIDYSRQLAATESIESIEMTTDLSVGTLPYYHDSESIDLGLYRQLAIIQYENLDQTGTYANQVAVTTDQNRLLIHHYRVKVI